MENQNSQVSEPKVESQDEPYPAKQDNNVLLEKINLKLFIDEHFKNTYIEDWSNWQWQIKNSITDIDELSHILGSKGSDVIINMPKDHLPFRITPYFTYLLSTLRSDHPLYKTVIPSIYELNSGVGEKDDPLDEQEFSPVPNIVHRYPDRALFLTTGFCSFFCRYCTRSHNVANRSSIVASEKEWEKGFEYLESHSEIRDVIVSGGDPLTLSDDKLEYILSRLRSIKHVEIIRIGTKVPVVMPMRITDELCSMFEKYHPLYLNIHFTHPDEITEDVKEACNKLSKAGIPLGSQTVLLKGINDDTGIMKKLMQKLLYIRVKPYYIFQMDKIIGGDHFSTPISKGFEILDALRGHTSGFACPQYVVDSSKGKISLLPNFVKSIEETDEKRVYTFRNYNNEETTYSENKNG